MDGPLTITAAMPLMRNGELTPNTLLEQCLARMDVYEPHVKAWVYVDRERARKDAAVLTDELRAGKDRGPLHGIPIGVKDIIDVFDMPTACGSKLWANSYARQDAEVVANLRRAGALILGKTVTTPYAYLDPSVTRNPWNLERTPGGSSSGSAAAVACGMCLAALATQTGGSTIRPASYCGVYALKPAWGSISVDGVLPLAPNLDHIGIMANGVRDLACMYQAICGPGRRGLIELNSNCPIPDCLSAIDRGMKDSYEIMPFNGLFVEKLNANVSGYYSSLLEKHEDDLNDPLVPPASFQRLHEAYLAIISTQAAEYHAPRRARHPAEYGAKFNELIDEGLRCSAVSYYQARVLQDDISEEMTRMLSGTRFLLMPATPNTAPTAETTGDPSFCVPWSFAGMPVISLPAGDIAELPFGVQVVGTRNCEDDLFCAAAWIDKSLDIPKHLPPVPR